jgi:pimeloyl-ACP methyl ester carboxylesterase
MTSGYASVNGLKMYYEIEGTGDPLVYIPAALVHAGMRSFAELAQHHSIIKIDVQGHGRTADIPERPRTLEQDAEDIVALLRCIGVPKADFFGESYGGAIAIIIAIRHPELVRRVATFGATFGPAELAHNRQMLRFDQPPTPDSRCFQVQKAGYQSVAPDPDYWPQFWNKVVSMQWAGFSQEELASIQAPVLIALGDHDFVRVEHALETYRLIPHAELAVIPDAGHFLLFSEPERAISVLKHFLEKPENSPPVATASAGYQPGETR